MSWLARRAAARFDDDLVRRPDARPAGDDDDLLALAADLSRLPDGPRPDSRFRAETRVRLMALAEQRSADLLATPSSAGSPAEQRSAPSPAVRSATARRREGRHQLPSLPTAWSRRLAGVVAVLAVVVLALSLLTVVSRGALPGDNLYAVKRAAESVHVGLTLDDVDRGFVLLDQAERRLDEVAVLLGQPVSAAGTGLSRTTTATGGSVLADGPSEPVLADGAARRIIETLTTMDQLTASGISLLTDSAVAADDIAALDIIPVWAEGQQGQLDGILDEFPAQAQAQAEASLQLLNRVGERARSLEQDLSCDCEGPADDLGPVPCVDCTAPGTPPTTDGSAPPS